MNASLWQLAGWTMIHSLWLGAIVALAGGFLRLACRRAAPHTRYAISLATLALLAATPLAAAAWLSVNGMPVVDSILPPPPRGSNEHDRQWRSSAGGSPCPAPGWGGGRSGYTRWRQFTGRHPSPISYPSRGGGPNGNKEEEKTEGRSRPYRWRFPPHGGGLRLRPPRGNAAR